MNFSISLLTRFLAFAAGISIACQAHAQQAVPPLAQIKIAADAGDPAAQDKLAENFIMRGDSDQAMAWYRKAAAQGFAHSQGKLGYLLLLRSRTSVLASPAERSAIGEEARKWIILAANQGDKRGQADFADICLEGKLMKQDLVEAYKWGDLAAQGSMIDTATITGRSCRDSAILKMDAGQIAEARKRVAAFVPHQPTRLEIPTAPEPSWAKQIKLIGISGPVSRRLAIINNQTFEKGDEIKVKVAQQSVNIRCIEVGETSAIVMIEGLESQRELKLKRD